jgi:carboxyl-terminal processing protease
MTRKNLGLIMIALVFALLWWRKPAGIAQREDYSVLAPLVDVRHLIKSNYVDPVEDEELVDGAIEGMVSQLDVPFSDFLSEEELVEFEKTVRGEFTGIGIEIGLVDGELIVISPVEDSPAFEAGIRAGDRILKVNGDSTEKWGLRKMAKTVGGKPGTVVALTVSHEDGTIEKIAVTRKQIQLETVKGWRRNKDDRWEWIFTTDDKKIGYVRVTAFYSDTLAQLDSALVKLSAARPEGLILDLRNNPGGVMSSALVVADRFLDSGVIVSVRGRSIPPGVKTAHKDKTFPPVPMAVLIDKYSASGAEIVAGALGDNGRAVLVGMRTYGKGRIQKAFSIPDGKGALKLTVARYYLPSGRCIDRKAGSVEWGVIPDVQTDLSTSRRQSLIELRMKANNTHDVSLEQFMKTDTQLVAAVETIAGFEKWEEILKERAEKMKAASVDVK